MTSTERPVFNDRYEIQQRIGRGGMADVFLARDRLLDRPVAIKVLFPEFATDPNFVERFRREAQSAANLNHPNIVGVYDWGRQGTTYFMAMEYVQGRTLADILKANGKLNAHQASDIAAEVAAALGFAHRNGVVHRDVKPANILIANDGRVKVADFGIARALNSAAEQDLTQAGAVMGTATYFSPEQAQGGQPDPRSDLYSLGIVLYEMVGGRPPFAGDNPVAIAYKQVHDQPQPLNQLTPDVPRPFEAIVAKLLAKNPALRYPTAEALRDDLRRFREGQPVQALAGLTGGNGGAAPPTTAVPDGGAHHRDADRRPRPTPPPPRWRAPPRSRPRPAARRRAPEPPQYYDSPRRTGLYVLAAFLAVAALVAGGLVLFKLFTKDDTSSSTVRLPDVRNQTDRRRDQDPEGARTSRRGGAGGQGRRGRERRLRPGSRCPTNSSPPIRRSPSRSTRRPSRCRCRTCSARTSRSRWTSSPPSGSPIPRSMLVEDTDEHRGHGDRAGPAERHRAQSPATRSRSRSPPGKAKEVVPNVRATTRRRPSRARGARVRRDGRAAPSRIRCAAGKVIASDPPADTAVDKGSTVKIFVSKGPAQVEVPDLVGLTLSQALITLQNADLKGNPVEFTVPAGRRPRRQGGRPEPGRQSKVAKGSTVQISVGKAAPAPSTTTTTTTTTTPTDHGSADHHDHRPADHHRRQRPHTSATLP